VAWFNGGVSTQPPFSARDAGSLPRGETIATLETYPEAQALVDRLAKADFDVSTTSIVGSDLKTVERVTGKLSYGKAALTGAANGAFMGLIFAVLLSLFTPDPTSAFRLMAAAVLATTGLGMILSLISYAVVRRRRDFSSTRQVIASSYQVIVPPERAAAARLALGEAELGSVGQE